MKVMILGGEGQLGLALMQRRPQDVEAFSVGAETNITKLDALEKAFKKYKPHVVINAAAYTNVEGAESNEMKALEVNGEGPANIVEVANQHNARVIHISTDFVFDGKKSTPYTTADTPHPINVYGLSKLKGEKAVLEAPGDHSVVRTSWLYFYYGNNFVQTMLRLMTQQSELRIVVDQVGSPTSAITLSLLLWRMAKAEPKKAKGLWHYSDCGVASWYDFAVSIQALGFAEGLIKSPCAIHPIPTSAYPTKAQRPSYSVLDCQKTREVFDFPAVHWLMALREIMSESVILPPKT